MSTPPERPERQSRARAGLGVDPTPAADSAPTTRAATTRSAGGAPPVRPTTGPERAVDLDRLRASAASALSAERAPTSDSSRPSASDGRERVAPSTPTSGGAHGWLKIALPVVVVAALATVGVTVLGGGTDGGSAPSASTTEVTSGVTAPPTTAPAAPTTASSETIVPSTSAAPTTAAAPANPSADPTAPPPHKATYHDGKLYLEGRITSDAEAQKYVEKAAAVLGPDNVVNNYVVDPTVPLSTDGTVYVDEPFLFETGSAELNPQYTGVLGLGVAALKLNPAARLVVTGYTDNQGDPAKNQQLSLARANAVVEYMVTTGGIDRSRFDAIGAGDQNPVGDNTTAEGRALNRRIDVKLVNLLG
ncbi:MAG TPA: OmpA family protein [Microthrixaceae bacterium]|jgi:outer membrane protein OmpA-like peptidoglycan-associated protein|nr:OmpA family protein [Microthrixaceae bacterium]HQF92525.1 OmpA family protein [Microthrixaceae bacterium]